MARRRPTNYYDAFFDRFDQLAKRPYLYQAVDDIREGYRRSVCGVDSIYYRVDGDTVEIMAILGQQDVDEWIERTTNPVRNPDSCRRAFLLPTANHANIPHDPCPRQCCCVG